MQHGARRSPIPRFFLWLILQSGPGRISKEKARHLCVGFWLCRGFGGSGADRHGRHGVGVETLLQEQDLAGEFRIQLEAGGVLLRALGLFEEPVERAAQHAAGRAEVEGVAIGPCEVDDFFRCTEGRQVPLVAGLQRERDTDRRSEQESPKVRIGESGRRIGRPRDVVVVGIHRLGLHRPRHVEARRVVRRADHQVEEQESGLVPVRPDAGVDFLAVSADPEAFDGHVFFFDELVKLAQRSGIQSHLPAYEVGDEYGWSHRNLLNGWLQKDFFAPSETFQIVRGIIAHLVMLVKNGPCGFVDMREKKVLNIRYLSL